MGKNGEYIIKPTTFRTETGRSANLSNPPWYLWIKIDYLKYHYNLFIWTILLNDVQEQITLYSLSVRLWSQLPNLFIDCAFFLNFYCRHYCTYYWYRLLQGNGKRDACSASVFNLISRRYVFLMDLLWFPNSIGSSHTFLLWCI